MTKLARHLSDVVDKDCVRRRLGGIKGTALADLKVPRLFELRLSRTWLQVVGFSVYLSLYVNPWDLGDETRHALGR